MRKLGYNEPQARMTRSALWHTQQNSRALHAMLKDTDTLPSWVNSKIAVASADIGRVRRYLDYKLVRQGQARRNPAAVISRAEEKKLARAVKRLAPKLNREMKSRKKVVASAALQLRALLHEQPASALAFIDTMLGNLAQADPQAMKPGQHAFTAKVYLRMRSLWVRALKG